MNQWKNIVCMLILGLTIQAYSQDFILGARYGYGKASYKRQSDGLMIPNHAMHRMGISLEFSPYFSKLFLVSGIEFETNDLGSSLSIPLGFRVCIGNKFRPFLELGAYYSHPLRTRDTIYTITRDAGVRAGAGLLYTLNKRWRIELGYFHRFGFKGVLGEEIPLPAGNVTFEQYDLRNGNLELGVKYRF
jgi:opacity protein-like surface antigen